jgi:cytoskeleton protein RodZ
VSEAAARELSPASGPGPMLRLAREARGLSEQQAAEQLNLDVTVVEALEREDFAALGAPVFARGHLRRYGGLLGIGEEQLLAAYARAQAQPDTPTLVPRSRQEMMPVRGRPRWPWVVGGALAFVIAAGIGAYVSEYDLRWPGSSADGDGTRTSEAAPSSGVPPQSAPSADATVAAAGPGATGPALASGPPQPLPQGHVRVSLTFAADSWVEVYDGSGKAVLYDLGRAGAQRAITAAAPLSVTFGNPSAVTLVVNGRPTAMPPSLAGQTVVRFRIGSDGSLR